MNVMEEGNVAIVKQGFTDPAAVRLLLPTLDRLSKNRRSLPRPLSPSLYSKSSGPQPSEPFPIFGKRKSVCRFKYATI